jgi:hypothetical protein
MKTKIYTKLTNLTLVIMLLCATQVVSALEVTKSVLAGEGEIELFKNGKKVLPTTEFAAGDTLIVFASPAENEALTFLMIGENIYYSSPILVEVNSNIDIQAGFEAKRILFKETFGAAQAFVTQLGGGVDGGAYAGYDTPADVAEISTINGLASNSKIHNYPRNTNDTNYDPDNADNPHTTHVYLQASNLAVKFAAGKELVGENIQIKFRHVPVKANDANTHYNYDGLQVKLNNTSFTALEYGNSVKMHTFWNNSDNPDDPENTELGSLTTYIAPFVVITVPENYPNISSIMISQSQQSTPFNNRCRIDDIIVVADGDPSSVYNVSNPTVFAVVSDIDVEFRGELKIGDKISIFDLTGTVVKSQIVNSDRVLISTYNLPAGVYVAFVKDQQGEVNSFKIMLK